MSGDEQVNKERTGADPIEASAREVLKEWGYGEVELETVSSGHINRTFFVHAGAGQGEAPRHVLQRLNPIFKAEIHLDIEAVTRHLHERGIHTPLLVPTDDGRLWVTDANGGVWRIWTYVSGEILLAVDTSERCEQAGRMVGRFHRALWDFAYTPRYVRFNVHDTALHLKRLEEALTIHTGHPSIGEVRPVAEAILTDASQLFLERDLPLRLVHGDPKISNIVFGPQGQGLCLIDLDTLNRMPIAVELGDALRSWCCPKGEEIEASLDVPFFEAGLRGYAEAVQGLPGRDEVLPIPRMVQTIALELAARFCADALNESYFASDPRRFSSASQHNLVRARAQLSLARSVLRCLDELDRINRAVWQGS